MWKWCYAVLTAAVTPRGCSIVPGHVMSVTEFSSSARASEYLFEKVNKSERNFSGFP